MSKHIIITPIQYKHLEPFLRLCVSKMEYAQIIRDARRRNERESPPIVNKSMFSKVLANAKAAVEVRNAKRLKEYQEFQRRVTALANTAQEARVRAASDAQREAALIASKAAKARDARRAKAADTAEHLQRDFDVVAGSAQRARVRAYADAQREQTRITSSAEEARNAAVRDIHAERARIIKEARDRSKRNASLMDQFGRIQQLSVDKLVAQQKAAVAKKKKEKRLAVVDKGVVGIALVVSLAISIAVAVAIRKRVEAA